MADKSPRKGMSKTSGMSLKQKRAEKKAEADTSSGMEKLTHPKKG